MRVVSQHGNVDLPYERTVICHGEDSVIARCDGNAKRRLQSLYTSKMQRDYFHLCCTEGIPISA